jgi:hypothetical protein
MKVGKRLAHLIMILTMIPMLSGCFFLLGAAGGAAGGYVASEKGYKVQSPITKEESKKEEPK